MLLGKIGFDQHRVVCSVGVTEEERAWEQILYVDLRVSYDFTHCVQSENIDDALCYVQLSEICTELAQTGKYHLLETMVHEMIKKILVKDHVQSVWIRVKKPAAIPTADYALVELEMRK